MDLSKLPHWLRAPIAAIAAAGGIGIFAIAFLDSTFLPLPSISDFLLIEFSIQYPARMPYYALMSVLGSLAGCFVLYYIAHKGGEIYFRKHAGARADRIRGWVSRNGFLTIVIGSLAPPPTPFKIIVFGAGAFEMPVSKFVLALALARAIRFFGEGFLAMKYGNQANDFIAAHKIATSLGALGIVLAIYFVVRIVSGPAKSEA